MTRDPQRRVKPDAPWIREVLERYERPLTLYASRLLGDVERARDVVQETFLRLCNQDRSAIEEGIAVWLFTVCRNLSCDVQRKESRMSQLEEESAETVAGVAANPGEELEARDTLSRVMETITSLPEKQQEVLRLKFQHGLSYQEISRVTQEKIGTVGWLIHVGLKGVREKLAASEMGGVQA
jgi:RNA polymerase sigma factor (sigma-70 family)